MQEKNKDYDKKISVLLSKANDKQKQRIYYFLIGFLAMGEVQHEK